MRSVAFVIIGHKNCKPKPLYIYILLSCLQRISLSEIIHRDNPNTVSRLYYILRLLTTLLPTGVGRFSILGRDGGGGQVGLNLGIGRLLVGHWGPQAIVKIIWGGVPCTYSPTPCSYGYVTCTDTLWNQSWKGVHSLYIVLIANHCSIIRLCTCMFLAAVGTRNFLFQTFSFIKKYPEMGRRYYHIVSSHKGLLYRSIAIDQSQSMP